jgi:hypothetical protein
MTEPESPTTESVMESTVQSLFAVFGAPDDAAVATHADDLLELLHERLTAAATEV